MGTPDRNISNLDYARLLNQLSSDVGHSAIPAENIHQLYLLLKQAKKVKSDIIPANIVTMNSNVIVRYVQSGEVRTVKIVYPGNSEPNTAVKDNPMAISIYNPLALSILGMKENDICFSRNGEGEDLVMIDKILFQPEAHRIFSL